MMINRINSLDVLRFIAIFLVLLWHWLPEDHFTNYIYNGKLGVNIFFVLSGYLISKGLYLSKENNLFKVLRSFYLKRFIRIFPIYYLLIGFLVIINYSFIREVQWWYWLYTVNIYTELELPLVPYTQPLWSLGVEEQFYIVWPVIFLFFIRKKQMTNSFYWVIILSSITFYIFYSFYKLPFLTTFNYFFCFASGALLFNKYDIINKVSNFKLSALFLFSFLLSLFASYLFRNQVIDFQFLNVTLEIVFTCFSALLLLFVLKNKDNKLFNSKISKALAFIGKISYGIYLYHYLMYPLNHYFHVYSIEHNWWVKIPEFSNIYIRFFYLFLLTFITAILSYHIIEKPIINKFYNRIK